jgi:futalosine hydrolase
MGTRLRTSSGYSSPDRRITTLTTADAPFLLVAATDRELCGLDGLVCGVGPVEAAAATARALALHDLRAVLHLGLAGGRGIAPGSLVVGTEAVYCDLSAEWPVVDRVAPDASLVAVLRAALPEAHALAIHTSAAVGGARTLSSHGLLVEAMEGFGVLRAAALAGVPAVEVRAVSNEIGEDDRARWDLDGGLAALERALPAALEALRAHGS